MSVRTQVEYLVERSRRPVYHASRPGRDAAHTVDQPMHAVAVEVDDARRRPDEDERDEFGQHPSGFRLLSFPTRVDDFLDVDQVGSVYQAEIEGVLRSVTGCDRVHVFDHTVRASDPDQREVKQVREPASLVHND